MLRLPTAVLAHLCGFFDQLDHVHVAILCPRWRAVTELPSASPRVIRLTQAPARMSSFDRKHPLELVLQWINPKRNGRIVRSSLSELMEGERKDDQRYTFVPATSIRSIKINVTQWCATNISCLAHLPRLFSFACFACKIELCPAVSNDTLTRFHVNALNYSSFARLPRRLMLFSTTYIGWSGNLHLREEDKTTYVVTSLNRLTRLISLTIPTTLPLAYILRVAPSMISLECDDVVFSLNEGKEDGKTTPSLMMHEPIMEKERNAKRVRTMPLLKYLHIKKMTCPGSSEVLAKFVASNSCASLASLHLQICVPSHRLPDDLSHHHQHRILVSHWANAVRVREKQLLALFVTVDDLSWLIDLFGINVDQEVKENATLRRLTISQPYLGMTSVATGVHDILRRYVRLRSLALKLPTVDIPPMPSLRSLDISESTSATQTVMLSVGTSCQGLRQLSCWVYQFCGAWIDLSFPALRHLDLEIFVEDDEIIDVEELVLRCKAMLVAAPKWRTIYITPKPRQQVIAAVLELGLTFAAKGTNAAFSKRPWYNEPFRSTDPMWRTVA